MKDKIKQFIEAIEKDREILKKYKNLDDIAVHLGMDLSLEELSEAGLVLGESKGCSLEGTKVFYDMQNNFDFNVSVIFEWMYMAQKRTS